MPFRIERSYYKKDWGFCLSFNQYKEITDKKYYVKNRHNIEERIVDLVGVLFTWYC